MSDAERLARAVLMFHQGSPWLPSDAISWQALTGERDCTTKALCDLARQTLRQALITRTVRPGRASGGPTRSA
jgi:hypothetical protein